MRFCNKVGVLLILLFLFVSSVSLGNNTLPNSDTTLKDNKIGTVFYSGPTIDWQQFLGSNDTRDTTKGILPVKDGGYIILGDSISPVDWSYKWWIVKVDSKGELLWNITFFENELDSFPFPISLASGVNEGFVLVGVKEQENSNNIWFIKFDDYGNELWNITYRIRGIPNDIIQTEDGYIVVGEFLFEDDQPVAGVLKIDEIGNLAWTNDFEGTLVSTTEVDDEGFYLVGENSHDAMIIKIDSHGHQQWNKTYPLSNRRTQFNAIERTDNGNLVVIGEVNNFIEGYHEMRFVKIDVNGNLILEKIIDGPYDSEIGLDIDQTTDGSFVVLGCYGSVPGGKMCLVKIDSKGTNCWEKSIDGYVILYMYGDEMIHPTKDGGYVLTGMTEIPGVPAYFPNVFITKYCSEDVFNPTVTITKPENGLYFNNNKIFDIKRTIIFGTVDIKANVTDDETGVDHVEIYVDDMLRANLTIPPYVCAWEEKDISPHTIKIVGYDHAGNYASKELKNIWKIF